MCPANFLPLQLRHNDASVPAEPEIPWRRRRKVQIIEKIRYHYLLRL